VARRRLLGYAAPLDYGSWYRAKHAAPSPLIRLARRVSLALVHSRARAERPATAARPEWPRLTVIGFDANAARPAA